MNQNNYSNNNNSMDNGQSPSSASSVPPPGMNEQNFLQQLFTADVAAINQQQQQQGFFYNPNVFSGQQTASVQGAVPMNFDQMLAQQQQQQQQIPNLFAFANQGQLQAVNPALFGQQMNNAAASQQQPSTSSPFNPIQNTQLQQGGGGGNNHSQSLLQYDGINNAAAPQASCDRNSSAMVMHNEAVSDIGGVSVPPSEYISLLVLEVISDLSQVLG